MEDSKIVDTEELASFRQQWREELGLVMPTDHEQHLHVNEDRPQAEAAGLYWMGVAAERSGDMHGAIMYYRQAVQLVPDIEFKVSPKDEPKLDPEDSKHSSASMMPLREAFKSLSLGAVCEPLRVCKEVHISALPIEVLRYIFRWVVSAQLDLTALEQLSAVCRGFYLLAREPDIWRRACRRLWGDCNPAAHDGEWRSMFIHRPHLYFTGIYISKTTYIRPGERSLDRLYKPYHTVTYYRYLRFFPDGSVMYQTSPEEPALVVGKLAHKHSSAAVLQGHYSVQGNTVEVDVLSYRTHIPVTLHMRHCRQKADVTHEDWFHMELLLKGSTRQKFNQLQWQQHHCHSLHRPSGCVQVSRFSIDYKYTPFFFSRMKGFTKHSSGLLT